VLSYMNSEPFPILKYPHSKLKELYVPSTPNVDWVYFSQDVESLVGL
jgi:hypothetical protein